MNPVKYELRTISLTALVANQGQPRKDFTEIEELSASIAALGLLQPPLVRYLAISDRYQIISGERRCRACAHLGHKTIPVLICRSDDLSAEEMALVENIQRVDLNPIEIASALKKLEVDYNLSQEELALVIGKNRSTVANYLRLLRLPGLVRDSLATGTISMGHAKALLSMEGGERQISLLREIERDGLSVREAERRAQSTIAAKAPTGGRREGECHVNELQGRLEQLMGRRVRVSASKGNRGKIELYYYDLDDLEALTDRLLGDRANESV